MPYCPNCNEEFEEGMSACVSCGADLVDSPLYEEGGDNLASFEGVFVGPMALAFEVKAQLEQQGFQVYVQGADVGSDFEADLGDGSSLVRILVPIESADTASEIIENLTREAEKSGVEDGFALVEDGPFQDGGFDEDDPLEAGDEDLADPGVFGASPAPEPESTSKTVTKPGGKGRPGDRKRRALGGGAKAGKGKKGTRKRVKARNPGKGKSKSPAKKSPTKKAHCAKNEAKRD